MAEKTHIDLLVNVLKELGIEYSIKMIPVEWIEIDPILEGCETVLAIKPNPNFGSQNKELEIYFAKDSNYVTHGVYED